MEMATDAVARGRWVTVGFCETDVSCGDGGERFEEAVAGMAACACSAGVL